MAQSQTIHEAVLAIRADSAQLRTDLAKSRNILEGGLRDYQAMVSRFAGILGVSLGAAGLISFFRSSFAELEKQESAQASLEATLRSTGQASQQYTNYLLQQATALQQVTTFGDDAILGVQQQLIAFGASGQEIQKLTELTLDLAAGMRMDLAGAARLMGRAIAGEFGTLSRYGITVDENASKSEKLNQALKQIEERFGGQARAQAETFTGAIKQMANAWGDFKEAVAGVVASQPALEKMLRGMTAILLETTQRMQGTTLEALKSTVKNLTESAARSAGQAPARIALMSDEELTRFAEQSRFAKGEITSLIEARKRLADFLKTQAPLSTEGLPTGKPKPLIDPDAQKKIEDRSRSFFDTLQKQLDQTRNKIKETFGGEGSALGDELDALFSKFKRDMAADKLPLPKAAEERFLKLRDSILAANKELRQTKILLEREAIDDADLATGRQAETEALLAPFKAEDEMVLQRINEASERYARDFDDMAEATRAWREEGAKAARIGDELTIELQKIDKEALIFGMTFDSTGAQIAALTAHIKRLIAEGLDPLGAEIQENVEKLNRLQARQDLAEGFRRITDSISTGLRDTIRGISEGSQSRGAGLNNAIRNMLLSLNEAQMEAFIIQPVKRLADAFFAGFVDEFINAGDKASEKAAKGLGASLGRWLRDVFKDFSIGGVGGSGGIGGLLSGAWDWIKGLFFHEGGLVPAYHTGGIVLPRFHSGGEVLGRLQEGEYVVRRPAVQRLGLANLAQINRTGEMPDRSGGESRLVLDFQNAQIIPRAPWTTPADVVKVSVQNLKDHGPLRGAIAEYGPKK